MSPIFAWGCRFANLDGNGKVKGAASLVRGRAVAILRALARHSKHLSVQVADT